MLASITPFGERGRHNRFAITASAFVVGGALGGILAGAVAGLAGAALFALVSVGMTARVVVGLVVVVAAALVDAGVGGVTLPTSRRQVDERWLTRYRGWVYGVGFGFQLGLGLVTIVTTAAVYATFAIAALTGSVKAGALIGLVFGLTRGASIFAAARIENPEALRTLHRNLATRAPAVARAGVVTQLAVAGAATMALVVIR
jgi:hypothetical protein